MHEPEALRWISDELLRLVAIPSFSADETAVAERLMALATDLGLPARSLPVAGCGPNVLVGWHSQPRLLLTAHTDTITPTWDWLPLVGVDGHVVRGLGAQDDKGGVLACLLALVLARDSGVDLASLSVGVGLCVDEEDEGRGSRQLAAQLMPRHVVALEGTGLRVANVEAGYVQGVVDVPGRRAHHALVEEGDNAIEGAAGLVVALADAPFTRHTHPSGAASTVSTLGFTSTSPVNVVPDHAQLYVEARLFGPTPPPVAAAQLDELCVAHGATFTLEGASDGFETPPDAPLTRGLSAAAERVLGETRPLTAMPARTDGHSFATIAGADTLVFGPGHLRTAHGPDEHIDTREILACARVLAELLSSAAATLDLRGP